MIPPPRASWSAAGAAFAPTTRRVVSPAVCAHGEWVGLDDDGLGLAQPIRVST